MFFFGTKAFLILAIITVKIVYLGFLVSYINGVALIIQISRVFSKLQLSIVSCVGSSSVSGSVLSIGLILDLGSLSIFFIVEYQFFQYLRVLSLNFCLVQDSVVVRTVSCGSVGFQVPGRHQQKSYNGKIQWNSWVGGIGWTSQVRGGLWWAFQTLVRGLNSGS